MTVFRSRKGTVMLLTFCLILFTLMQLPTMAQYITHLDVSINADDEELLQSQGYTKIDVDLNKGSGGNTIYLWYKRGGQNPITRVQATFSDDMGGGFTSAGYTKIDKNLNAGAGGHHIYLWYYSGSGEFHTPIVGIDVTTDAESDANKVSLGWERVACDLNHGAEGNWIHVWVRREPQTYVCDVAATDSYASNEKMLKNGYIRMDEDTNREAGGNHVFIWYRQTNNSQSALYDLAISTNNYQYQYLQQHNYDPVSVDLNKGTGGNMVYLWHKKANCNNPIKSILLLLRCDQADVFKTRSINVIDRNLNTGNNGRCEYLSYYK